MNLVDNKAIMKQIGKGIPPNRYAPKVTPIIEMINIPKV